jgi:hypothetical protein
LSVATGFSFVPVAGAALGVSLLAAGPPGARQAGTVLAASYAVAVGGAAALAGLRFRSSRVGLLGAPALVVTQAAFVAGFVRGLVRGR